MYPTDLRARLDSALEPDPRQHPAPGDRLAGVLVPVVGGSSVIVTRRSATLSRHAGEISFPGGIRHDEDGTVARTALRETEEELGIAAGEIELLGALPPVHTFVSAILIVPFVGILRPGSVFHPNEDEIAEVLSYGLEELAAAETEVEWAREGHVYRGHAYEMEGATIWGATAKILHSLLALIRGERA